MACYSVNRSLCIFPFRKRRLQSRREGETSPRWTTTELETSWTPPKKFVFAFSDYFIADWFPELRRIHSDFLNFDFKLFSPSEQLLSQTILNFSDKLNLNDFRLLYNPYFIVSNNNVCERNWQELKFWIRLRAWWHRSAVFRSRRIGLFRIRSAFTRFSFSFYWKFLHIFDFS